MHQLSASRAIVIPSPTKEMQQAIPSPLFICMALKENNKQKSRANGELQGRRCQAVTHINDCRGERTMSRHHRVICRLDTRLILCFMWSKCVLDHLQKRFGRSRILKSRPSLVSLSLMIPRQPADAAVDMQSKGIFHPEIKLLIILLQLNSDVASLYIIDSMVLYFICAPQFLKQSISEFTNLMFKQIFPSSVFSLFPQFLCLSVNSAP